MRQAPSPTGCFRGSYSGPVRVATWNVNSVRQRVRRLLPWLDQRQPDVLCLQETKLADDAFTELLGDELDRRGYAVALHGEPRWNGVAIASRAGLDDVVAGIPGGPRFPRPAARAGSATRGGVPRFSGGVPERRGPRAPTPPPQTCPLAALCVEVAREPGNP